MTRSVCLPAILLTDKIEPFLATFLTLLRLYYCASMVMYAVI